MIMLFLIFSIDFITFCRKNIEEESDLNINSIEQIDLPYNTKLQDITNKKAKKCSTDFKENVIVDYNDFKLKKIRYEISNLKLQNVIFQFTKLKASDHIAVASVIDYFINRIKLEKLNIFFEDKVPRKYKERLDALSDFFKINGYFPSEKLEKYKGLRDFFDMHFRIDKDNDKIESDTGIKKITVQMFMTYRFLDKKFKDNSDFLFTLQYVLYKMKEYLKGSKINRIFNY